MIMAAQIRMHAVSLEETPAFAPAPQGPSGDSNGFRRFVVPLALDQSRAALPRDLKA
jgi:hypothetical protein